MQKEERTNEKGKKRTDLLSRFSNSTLKKSRGKKWIFETDRKSVCLWKKNKTKHGWSVLCMTSGAERRCSHRVCILPHESSLGSMEFAGQLAPGVVFDPREAADWRYQIDAQCTCIECSAGTFLTGRGGSAAEQSRRTRDVRPVRRPGSQVQQRTLSKGCSCLQQVQYMKSNKVVSKQEGFPQILYVAN